LILRQKQDVGARLKAGHGEMEFARMSLHPSFHARTMPDKVAYRMAGSGAAITYGELDRASN